MRYDPQRGIFHHEIARIAYQLWEDRGAGHSTSEQANRDWIKAEDVLRQRFERS